MTVSILLAASFHMVTDSVTILCKDWEPRAPAKAMTWLRFLVRLHCLMLLDTNSMPMDTTLKNSSGSGGSGKYSVKSVNILDMNDNP